MPIYLSLRNRDEDGQLTLISFTQVLWTNSPLLCLFVVVFRHQGTRHHRSHQQRQSLFCVCNWRSRECSRPEHKPKCVFQRRQLARLIFQKQETANIKTYRLKTNVFKKVLQKHFQRSCEYRIRFYFVCKHLLFFQISEIKWPFTTCLFVN